MALLDDLYDDDSEEYYAPGTEYYEAPEDDWVWEQESESTLDEFQPEDASYYSAADHEFTTYDEYLRYLDEIRAYERMDFYE